MLDNPWEALERQSQGSGVRGDSEDEASSKLRDAKLEESAIGTTETSESTSATGQTLESEASNA